MKWTSLLVVILLSGLGLGAEAPAAAGTVAAAGGIAVADVSPAGGLNAVAAAGGTAAVKDGYALLNSLLTLFDNLTLEKKEAAGENKVTLSGLALVDSRLSQLARDAHLALEAGVIDRIFYNRYQRMLTIFKLVTMPIIRNEMLKPLFLEAFAEFVWDTTYERWAWEDKDAIAKMAAAMEEEYVQMMTYLDTRQKRQELKAKIGKRILPPPPPPPPAKKKAEEKKPE